jgi:hypothetical protein
MGENRKSYQRWPERANRERLLIESLLRFVRRHVDVAKNLAERADGQRAVAMHGNHGIDSLSRHHVVAAANAKNGEALALQEARHVPAADTRQPSHE